MACARLILTRSQILGRRRRAGFLEERLPAGAKSLRLAAWAGLQDSMPRAALLSIHARVARTVAAAWEHPCLIQLWGPRYSNFVVAARDLPVFSLGRLPEDARGRARAQTMASRLRAVLRGRRMPYGEAGRALGIQHNSLRYAAPTGTVLMRWDGARQPVIWSVPAPDMDAGEARLELARRYLHVFGPATAASFAHWGGIRPADARTAWESLAGELMPVRTPVGDAWMLASDEPALQAEPTSHAPVRLLPSGDAYFLLWGADRELLVPDARRRGALWTSRVWPGALLINGELAGVWRRAVSQVSIEAWRRFTAAERESIEAEVRSLPLPGPGAPVAIRWAGVS